MELIESSGQHGAQPNECKGEQHGPQEITGLDELHDESAGEQCPPHLLNRRVIPLNDILNCKESHIGRYDAAGRSRTLP